MSLTDDPPISLLDALRAELADYERRKAKAAADLADDDDEYRAKVLKGWDHAIGVKRAQIAREEQRHATTVQS